ncbi:MAG TPA: D-glycerate dehydrogenase [Dissulfurispiraceae bacterium]|nr:D-glycerate dehydrogenase [Dissulfurispiraceae bacterium]
MKENKVYLTRMIPEKAVRYLEEYCSVEVNPDDRPLRREELIEKVKGMHAVLTMLNDGVDATLLDAAGPQCRIFANYAVGYNNIDIPAATKRGVFISNTPDVLRDATADLAWALMLAAARRITEGDSLMRSGAFTGWAPLFMLGVEVTGKILGIIGAGRIGQAVAQRGTGFGMKILYTANSSKQDFENKTGARRVGIDELLSQSDFISIHTPLTPATHHLIGQREFGMMKKTAILVNTARGPVVDEKALAEALRTGSIRGAGIDVYEREPEVEKGLLGLSNIVLCPHLGSATLDTRENMGLMAAENILAALRGEIPPQCLNPEAAE